MRQQQNPLCSLLLLTEYPVIMRIPPYDHRAHAPGGVDSQVLEAPLGLGLSALHPGPAMPVCLNRQVQADVGIQHSLQCATTIAAL